MDLKVGTCCQRRASKVIDKQTVHVKVISVFTGVCLIIVVGGYDFLKDDRDIQSG